MKRSAAAWQALVAGAAAAVGVSFFLQLMRRLGLRAKSGLTPYGTPLPRVAHRRLEPVKPGRLIVVGRSALAGLAPLLSQPRPLAAPQPHPTLSQPHPNYRAQPQPTLSPPPKHTYTHKNTQNKNTHSLSHTYTTGDLHGTPELFTLLERLSFRPSHDNLVLVGDLVNKGPASLRLLEALPGLGAVAVRGNHDDAALAAWLAWRQKGG